MRTLRSSELGTFLYCQRAWWYQRQGVDFTNIIEMAEGNRLHNVHGRGVCRTGLLKLLAWFLLFGGLVVLIYGLVSLLV